VLSIKNFRGTQFIRSYLNQQQPRPTAEFEPVTKGSSDHYVSSLTSAPRGLTKRTIVGLVKILKTDPSENQPFLNIGKVFKCMLKIVGIFWK
jgi:hypothetical protein